MDDEEPGAGESGEADEDERAQELCGGGPDPAKKTEPGWPLLRWWGDMRGSCADTGVAGWGGSGTGERDACG